ncbi:MAG: hypothetical protein ACREQ4_02195 [Candidatus Binataceae bacterium]
MGSREFLKDRQGRTLGRIDDNGRERIGYDIHGRITGRYDKQRDQTLDIRGQIVTTSGDALSSLITGRKK